MKYITFFLLLTALANAHGEECDSFKYTLDGLQKQVFQQQQQWNTSRLYLNSFYRENLVRPFEDPKFSNYPVWDENFWSAYNQFEATDAALKVGIQSFNAQVRAYNKICTSDK